MSRFDATDTLSQLKDFQLDTVEHVWTQISHGLHPTRRFLIADEVGLGKTMVARGIVAKTLERATTRGSRRVDVVYVASNAQIARQNLPSLDVTGSAVVPVGDRITLLPLTAKLLDRKELNLVSFTPQTSFELKSGTGTKAERLIVRMMLRLIWPELNWNTDASVRVFQGGVQRFDPFKAEAKLHWKNHHGDVPNSLIREFAKAVRVEDADRKTRGTPSLSEWFQCIVREARSEEQLQRAQRRDRAAFIGEARHLLARACLLFLKPDIVVLDEFQRFSSLLGPPRQTENLLRRDAAMEAAAGLARSLFSAKTDTRVLLLSATPYAMSARPAASASGDDEHEDLIRTCSFLLEHDQEKVDQIRRDLSSFRRGLLQVGEDGGAAATKARAPIQKSLRQIMVRTEKLRATANRAGMMGEVDHCQLALSADDVRSYAASARVARELDAQDPMEYWKSSPFLANFQGTYEVGRQLRTRSGARDADLAGALKRSTLLSSRAVQAYDQIHPDNPRMRWLLDDVVGRGSWKLLWIAPSLPYLKPQGPYAEERLEGFTKRLVFSSWRMTPLAIATLVTYETERRAVRGGGHRRPAYRNEPNARGARSRRLAFTVSKGRRTALPVWTLLYPSTVLARIGDPLQFSQSATGSVPTSAEAVKAVARQIKPLLDPLAGRMREEGQLIPKSGRADQRWYWLAPMWLDWMESADATDAYFAGQPAALARRLGDGQQSLVGFTEHIQDISDGYWGAIAGLGRLPDDLPEVLARVALGSPAIIALRCFGRVGGGRSERGARSASARKVAWAFHALFNGPEVTEIVRAQRLQPRSKRVPYWQQVLDYCIAGNLEAVLDEYGFVLDSKSSHLGGDALVRLEMIAAEVSETVQLRTVNYGITDVAVKNARTTVTTERMRANMAVRLGSEATDEGLMREGEVRKAFNSPFWPFVLATTSAGQEGLDFHHYSHAIVHWNLPASPVDLEQREGRVHRFLGHAVRKNVASEFGSEALGHPGLPWDAAFAAADRARPLDESEMRPWWVYAPSDAAAASNTDHHAADGAVIERYVPALPLSRDIERFVRLQRAVGVYRLAFGQPRPDELLAYLGATVAPEVLKQLAEELRIDLSPTRKAVEN
jgi:hypothetical protein